MAHVKLYNISVKNFWNDFLVTPVRKGELLIGWIGQAGFLFKDSADTILGIDPYLTDSVERNWGGLKRLMATIVTPEEYRPDILIASHFHEDHLDIDAMEDILNNGKTLLLSPQSSIDRIRERKLNVPESSYRVFKVGDKIEIKGIKMEAVYSDHGDMVPDPIGIYLIMEGFKIYYPGDTAYVPKVVEQAVNFRPDILIPPINGENGNLNSLEAAQLTRDSRAKTLIPCHFWTFAEHRGDPQECREQTALLAPDTKVLTLCQGEIYTYKG
jgi:L-ascorbate 6-phosphate lactonase